MEDMFQFHLDADVEKSQSGGDEHRLIRGYASTNSTDRQGESLLQKGLDISDFVKCGYFNYDHDNTIILGYPHPTCRIDDRGFWVEGELIKGIPEADKIWNLAIALKKSNAPRRVGFSVEGKVLERQGGQISKAKIYNVAITTNPVNTDCSWEAIVKSFGVSKALEAGYEINPLDMKGGSTFREEDLDTQLHNLSYVIGDEDKKKILKQKISKKTINKSELILYLQIAEGWSQSYAIDFISKNKLL